MATDILYIVGKGFSEWNNNELRYSLRSIAKNGRSIGRVYVCGYCPFWLNEDEVTLLPLRDEPDGNKHYNITRCIDYAIRNSDIGERFLYSSDDHYYVRPTDFETYPAYWRGKEIPTEMSAQPTWYETTLKSTHDVLEAFGLPTRFYAWHGNTWFNTRLWKQTRAELLRRLAATMPEACDPTCLMLNYWQAVEPATMPQAVERKDGKIGTAHTLEEIDQAAKAKEVLSTTDVVAGAMREWLQREFPNPCKYERN